MSRSIFRRIVSDRVSKYFISLTPIFSKRVSKSVIFDDSYDVFCRMLARTSRSFLFEMVNDSLCATSYICNSIPCFLTIVLLDIVITTQRAKHSLSIYVNQAPLIGFVTLCNVAVKQPFVFQLVRYRTNFVTISFSAKIIVVNLSFINAIKNLLGLNKYLAFTHR